MREGMPSPHNPDTAGIKDPTLEVQLALLEVKHQRVLSLLENEQDPQKLGKLKAEEADLRRQMEVQRGRVTEVQRGRVEREDFLAGERERVGREREEGKSGQQMTQSQ